MCYVYGGGKFKMKEKHQIAWEEFLKYYSITKGDHVHLTALMFQGPNGVGQPSVDPIVLFENKEKKDRHSCKFPGTGFVGQYLQAGFLTNTFEKELKSFEFEKEQYEDLLHSYTEQDWMLCSEGNIFLKSEYLLFFHKALILGVLQKTGMLVELQELPFYVDVGPNEFKTQAKIYRLFFEVTAIIEPKMKNKKFYNLWRNSIKLLHPVDYCRIVESAVTDAVLKNSLHLKLLNTYRLPLYMYLNRS